MRDDVRAQIQRTERCDRAARLRRRDWRRYFDKRYAERVEQARNLEALLKGEERADKLLPFAQCRVEDSKRSHTSVSPCWACRTMLSTSMPALYSSMRICSCGV